MRFLNEDLLVALCSGRNTMAGLLGKPDLWSFTMPGKIWVDQSWFSHLVYYLSYLMLDDLGPVLLKGLLLILCLIVLYLQCRRLGAELETTAAALVLGIFALAPFLQIRAENFGVLYFLIFAGILTSSASWRRWKQVACLGLLALWCNSHGSSMLGPVLLGVRVLLEMLCSSNLLAASGSSDSVGDRRSADTPNGVPATEGAFIREETGRCDPYGWLATWLASVAVLSFVNPYGTANALMPFRQLSASHMTSQSADWVALLDWSQFWQHGLLQPLDVKPFLILLTFIGALLAILLTSSGFRKKLRQTMAGRLQPEALMEVLIPIALVVMAFRFRRMILFAAAALVPVTAVLLQAHLDAVRERLVGWNSPRGLRITQLIAAGVLTICSLLLAEQFMDKTVLSYMPANPLRPDRPVISQLMSFDAYTMDVAQFMRDNGIKGRMLTSWTAAAFLLFADPEIRVFMDARDQSFYSDKIIDLYFSIMNSKRQDIPRMLQVLDQYQVSYAVLATDVGDFDLATFLMETKKWACIYMDNEFLLVGRVEDETPGVSFGSSSLNMLHYRSDDTRLLSEAVRSQFLNGAMPPEMLERLQEYCRREPDPDLYSLITLALSDKSPCLSSQARSFLMSEAQRLARMDYMVAGGATSIIKSLVIIAGILEGDELKCHAGAHAQTYAKLREGAVRVNAELEAKYRGY
jgi:hypothetical protein